MFDRLPLFRNQQHHPFKATFKAVYTSHNITGTAASCHVGVSRGTVGGSHKVWPGNVALIRAVSTGAGHLVARPREGCCWKPHSTQSLRPWQQGGYQLALLLLQS